jgi:hypothetical protein
LRRRRPFLHRSFIAAGTLLLLAGCSGDEPSPSGPGGSAGRAGEGGQGGGRDDGGSLVDRAAGGGGVAGGISDARDGALDDGALDATSSNDAEVGVRDVATDVVTEAPVTRPPPLAKLSATGLFTGVNTDGTLRLATGVMPFEPKYALWSDAAQKTRWVFLPAGKKIDTSDPDHWSFPVGTKFWKEFAINGKRVETRLIERFGPGPDDYVYAAYWWKPNDAGTAADAELADPYVGVPSANGTTHDIPKQEHCGTCHDPLKEHILGFGALELNHTRPGVTVTSLAQGAWLSQPLPTNLEFPGSDAKTRDALGYLHANCGNCHNTTPGVYMIPEPRMDLRALIGQTLDQTGAYKTALNTFVTKYDHRSTPPIITYRIAGGDTSRSCVSFRMAELGAMDRMPPIATKVVDTQGIATVNAWIATLPSPPDR